MDTFAKEIENVALRLPSLPKRERKNFFDILGVNTKETINSKILAYFFDAQEDHGFGTLFFDSLIDLLREKLGDTEELDSFNGVFEVGTEVLTANAELDENHLKRIDVSLMGDDWYIIIENKLFHHLQNPLEAYFQHAQKNNAHVKGVVLSLYKYSQVDCTQNNIEFINVTHNELNNKVEANLILSKISNDIDIFYLREYFKTINSHYYNDMNDPQNDKLVGAIIEQKDLVKNIIFKRNAAVEYLDRQIHEVFLERGYIYVKPWFCHPINNNLCFWVTSGMQIIENNSIGIAYELWNELKDEVGPIKLNEIHEQLKPMALPPFYIDDQHDKKRMKRIITYRSEEFLNSNKDVKSELSRILDDNYFNSGGVEDMVLSLLPQSVNLNKASFY